MNTEEILKEIKREKLNISQAQERVEILEKNLLGSSDLIHTAKGFLEYIGKSIELQGKYNYSEYSIREIVKVSDLKSFGDRGICIDYKDGWFINIKIGSLDKTTCTIYRFKNIGKLGKSYDEMIDVEKLIDIWDGDVRIFKDGQYIDFLKEKVFDPVIAKNIEKRQAAKLAKIKEHQENFTPIEF